MSRYVLRVTYQDFTHKQYVFGWNNLLNTSLVHILHKQSIRYVGQGLSAIICLIQMFSLLVVVHVAKQGLVLV